ncbi:hypothetical protein CMI41_00095 [Candidatus Pacearchaeota archaeon]|nr:hypothetical protein [Candidatus Pacearchaeota archaeon]|tara:strand:+ start:1208 stop:1747 length:540 start_codon:yes stop_codon:yes gene_type:complete
MKTLAVENLVKVKKAVPKIESRIKVEIRFGKNSQISIKGDELSEFVAEKIIEAVDFGFDVADALLLKKDDFVLEFIDIKSYTPRKNLKDVRGRVIGTSGKAKNTIEELTGCVMVVHDNRVGLIVDSEHLDAVVQGVISLIQGAKHGNVFSYLEKQNAAKRRLEGGDLGLKEKFAKKSDV